MIGVVPTAGLDLPAPSVVLRWCVALLSDDDTPDEARREALAPIAGLLLAHAVADGAPPAEVVEASRMVVIGHALRDDDVPYASLRDAAGGGGDDRLSGAVADAIGRATIRSRRDLADWVELGLAMGHLRRAGRLS